MVLREDNPTAAIADADVISFADASDSDNDKNTTALLLSGYSDAITATIGIKTLTNCLGLPLTTGVTGTLPVANGGTGVTSSTGTVAVVLSNSPTLVTPALGTPASGVMTNMTGLPITGITSSTSAELATLLSDETGSGLAVFNTSPTLVTPALGTPASGVATNLTGTASGLTSGNVTTNANLTGEVTSVGNAATLANTVVDVDNIVAASNLLISDLEIILDGGGSAITTGIKGSIVVDFDCTINNVTMIAPKESGSLVVDIWKDTFANAPPTVADTITAAALPTITTAQKSQDATLTGWTTTITAGDILVFNVNSATTITNATVSLKVTKVI